VVYSTMPPQLCISYIASNGRITVNDELKRMWKGAVMIYITVQFAWRECRKP
jgi:hypothetical protein